MRWWHSLHRLALDKTRVAADLAVADGRGFESQLNEPRAAHVSVESTLHPPRPQEAEATDQHSSDTAVGTKGGGRVGPLSLCSAALRWPTPAPIGDAGGKVLKLVV